MRFNALVPELSVSDLAASKRFYLDALGFTLDYARAESQFAFISYGSAQIMLEQVNGHWATGKLEHPFGRGINLQIASDDVEALRNKLTANGYALFRDIEEVEYRENETLHRLKEFLVQDPDGYLLRFSQEMGAVRTSEARPYA
ncbi:MAG: VOC family protein [Oscillospiraceae bacterium]|nr:VOC family protein [Oscillospiraceae bacterium]